MEEKTTEEKIINEDSSASNLSDEQKSEESQTILTPLGDYIKTASYLGTKVITPSMRKYVYRRRLDGLAILNTLIVDKKLSDGIDFIKQYKPDEWTLVCKREAGWRAAKMFSELTGVRTFTKKYPAGVLTNTVLDNFIETNMILICDPWLDKNALTDAKNIRIPVVGICDTNNHSADIDVVMIGNNKSNKSLGLFFWLLSREYMKAHNIKKELPRLEDFVGEELILEEPKKKRLAREKEERDLKSAESAIEDKMKALAEKADEEAKVEMKADSEEKDIKVGEQVSEGV
ncbi:30S ribosomal protein S2 [archaeon]|mgnify:FL=1|jgi:small subunit ribosomal protein S2|nr:30S ribosomal protein S2 [archaeon]MBT6182862.1 30S ribosomal protein S2 [archaeon]MBT6606735.1 30S ribosomal protein S2 [archaeon]MBT7251293.1 30S ribosomal protein S2 [archaeon]MBT7661205.1 30S ribosomal protein S2 [archaeon]